MEIITTRWKFVALHGQICLGGEFLVHNAEMNFVTAIMILLDSVLEAVTSSVNAIGTLELYF